MADNDQNITKENAELKEQNGALTKENAEFKKQNGALTKENVEFKEQNGALIKHLKKTKLTCVIIGIVGFFACGCFLVKLLLNVKLSLISHPWPLVVCWLGSLAIGAVLFGVAINACIRLFSEEY